MPQLRPLFAHVKTRVSAFLEEAGTVILALTIIIWALFAFPQHENQTQTYQMEHSYAGQLGKFIEPVIEPLGFDWKMGIGLIASFAAREVFITSLGVVYGLGAHEDENSRSLRAAMSKDINPKTGKSTYTPLVALSLMIFFAFAMQCMSTVAITRKETRTWKWPLVQLSYMTGLAWFGAFCVYQVGLILGYQ